MGLVTSVPRGHRARESVRRWALSLAGILEETGILGDVARRQPDVLTGEQGRPNPRRRQEPHPRSERRHGHAWATAEAAVVEEQRASYLRGGGRLQVRPRGPRRGQDAGR